MSASNWAECPRCKVRSSAAAAELRVGAQAAYGKVAEAVYLKMKERADAGPAKVESHFREDYELGVTDGGVLYVIYHGHCQDCGYGIDFKHEQPVQGLHDFGTDIPL